MYRNMSYIIDVTQAVSVRLGDEATKALGILEASRLSRSEAIHSSLVEGGEAEARSRRSSR